LNPCCAICGDPPTIKELIDYDPFCGIHGEISRHISRGKPTRAAAFTSLHPAEQRRILSP
jgi:hypothetical protein